MWASNSPINTNPCQGKSQSGSTLALLQPRKLSSCSFLKSHNYWLHHVHISRVICKLQTHVNQFSLSNEQGQTDILLLAGFVSCSTRPSQSWTERYLVATHLNDQDPSCMVSRRHRFCISMVTAGLEHRLKVRSLRAPARLTWFFVLFCVLCAGESKSGLYAC